MGLKEILRERKIARAPWWNYQNAAAYFITITCKNKQQYFGSIDQGKMLLSELGILAEKSWLDIPNHFQNVELGEFVVMPDHFHGIVTIHKSDSDVGSRHAVRSRHALTLQQSARHQNQGKNSLSAIVGSFKSAVTKMANLQGLKNGWQSRFHDHIIRDEQEYERIENYIKRNPENWTRS